MDIISPSYNTIQIDEQTLNEGIITIDLAIHILDDELVVVQAKLMFLKTPKELMESYIFLDNRKILFSITFAHIKIGHS